MYSWDPHWKCLLKEAIAKGMVEVSENSVYSIACNTCVGQGGHLATFIQSR
jgi:hypothetical protein